MENIPAKDDFHLKSKNINTLFQFIKQNKEDQFLDYISNLTKEELDPNMKDENGNYLIIFAITMNNRKIVRKVIEFGSRLDVLDSEGYGLLFYPIKFNYQEMIDVLLSMDKKTIGISLLNLKDAKGGVPIFYAIKYRNIYALQELLTNGADPNFKNSENMTPIHLAVLKKSVQMVRMLIRNAKNIDYRTLKGLTPLHYACIFQLEEIVAILLENGANQNISEIEYDFYPIFYSVIQNNVSITKNLVNYGANLNHQDYLGNTILHYLIINSNQEILDYVMRSQSFRTKSTEIYTEDINSKKDSKSDHIDPLIVNIDGVTITHLLLYSYKTSYDFYLKKLIAVSNLNYQDNSGNTILHVLAISEQWKKFNDIIQKKKLNIYIKNNQGQTVLDIIPLSEREKFIEIVTIAYDNYLKSSPNSWDKPWQNDCSVFTDFTEISGEIPCQKLIQNSILKDKISVPSKATKHLIQILPDPIVDFPTFTGSLLDMIVGFKYLSKKYPFATSLFHPNQSNSIELEKYNQSLNIRENPHQHIIHFEIRWIYQRIFFPPSFESIIQGIINSNKYRLIIISIGIILSNGNHSNSLLYDISSSQMERFEPHGSDYPNQFNYNPDLLDEILYKKMTNVLSNIYNKQITIKYLRPKNYLPKIGFQTLENAEINMNKNIGDPNGFCTLWTIWYLDYRIKYINKKPYNVAKNLIKEIKINNFSFRDIIRNYSQKITNLRDEYLSKINRNVNAYLNNKLEPEEIKNLLIEILTDNVIIS